MIEDPYEELQEAWIARAAAAKALRAVGGIGREAVGRAQLELGVADARLAAAEAAVLEYERVDRQPG